MRVYEIGAKLVRKDKSFVFVSELHEAPNEQEAKKAFLAKNVKGTITKAIIDHVEVKS